jgi:hypothetical protein
MAAHTAPGTVSFSHFTAHADARLDDVKGLLFTRIAF